MVKGNCRWIEGLFSSKDQGWSLSGIDLDLPVWFLSGEGSADQTIEKGALSVQSVTLPMLPEQAIHVSLDALANQLVASLRDNLKIPGGELHVGPVVCKNLHSPERSVETSLILEDVQVEPLLSQFWDHPMKGTIAGGFDPVRLEGDRIQSKGEISANVLNGDVTLSDFGVSRVFSPGPVLEIGARWNRLSLAELTSGTAFGKVQGILEGRINGLEIAYGQPQAFDLLLETVKTKGVSQKISVKAVDNISQLGGGQSPFMGVAGAFAVVFKEFPYKKIGIKASLENDVFRINGTIREGGKEYLIKRGSISGVNVVNQNPDNRVGFKDMVKRFKRVTAGKSSPVVK